MSTVPLVPAIQILACVPNSLRWCLLFPWYWPFKFKHAHPHQIFYADIYCSLGTDHSNSSMLTRTKNSMSMSSVPLVLMTLMSTVPLVPYWAFKHAFILMHHYVVTTKVSSHQHHNKNQLHLSYYSQHRHVVEEPHHILSRRLDSSATNVVVMILDWTKNLSLLMFVTAHLIHIQRP